MYLERCRIRNIKCFEDIELNFRNPDDTIRRWNVVIGENGTGKTVLLQAIAIALMGEKAASVLLPRPRGWVRTGADVGTIEAHFIPGNLDADVTWPDSDADAEKNLSDPIRVRYELKKSAEESAQDDGATLRETTPASQQERVRLARHSRSTAWLGAGYGPFRRLSGSAEWRSSGSALYDREARFVTLFREDAALTDCEEWLMKLDYARKDNANPEHQQRNELLYTTIQTTLNNYLLPDAVRLDTVSSLGVFFRTPCAERIRMADLSDGYRAMVALSIDLLRHLSDAYGVLLDAATSAQADWLKYVQGVVLIDELDAHLHPTWQRQIGLWLGKRFPGIQFIVTTHSPFITQIADAGGLYVLRQADTDSGSVEVHQDDDSVRGWRVEQILAILFDTPSAYDPDTEQQRQEYLHLNSLYQAGKLPQEQVQRFQELQAWVEQHLAPPGDTQLEMEHYRHVKQRAEQLSKLLAEQQTNDKD
jgi:predicted ATP-binding protein involved in virulence